MSFRLAWCTTLLATAIAGQTQQVGQNTSSEEAQGFTLRVQSNLVVEAVTVRDKQGNFIHGLTSKDFVLTENGAPQAIRYCEHQNLVEAAQPLPMQSLASENITIYNRLGRSQFPSETMDDERYKNRRLLAFYFDMTAMQIPDQVRALAASEKFVRTQMTAADLVAIMRYQGGSVDVLQDFTADRNRLLSILETMTVGESQGSLNSVDNESSTDTGAAFGQDDSEFNVFNTDRQLSALQTAAKML